MKKKKKKTLFTLRYLFSLNLTKKKKFVFQFSSIFNYLNFFFLIFHLRSVFAHAQLFIEFTLHATLGYPVINFEIK